MDIVRQTVDLVWLPFYRFSLHCFSFMLTLIVVVVLHDIHEWWTVLASVAVKQ